MIKKYLWRKEIFKDKMLINVYYTSIHVKFMLEQFRGGKING